MDGFLFLLGVVFVVTKSEAQTGIGTVNVGVTNTTGDEVYTFNVNYENDTEVPVYITVEDLATPIPDSDALDIYCELDPNGNPYSKAEFASVRIRYPFEDTALVPFSNAVYGKRTTVQCWAETEGTPEDDYPEFSKNVSIGNTAAFEIRPPGTVSCGNAVELVPDKNAYSDEYIYEFYVELSEDVEVGTVSIQCDQRRRNNNTLDLQFEDPQNLTIGERRTPVRYRVRDQGLPVDVECKAETVPATGNQQFIPGISTGDTATFILETGSLVLEPISTTLRTTQMSAFLVLDSAPDEALTFYCSVHVAENIAEADDIINRAGCDAATPPGGTDGGVTPNNASGWTLRNEIIEISDGSNFATVHLYKTGEDIYAQTSRPELVVIRCCAPDGIPEPKYEDMTTGLLAVTYLSPNYTTEWDDATDVDDEETEREILEPQYVEMSGCPCNLTIDACDIDCCCDEDCSSSDTDAFNCISGTEGGQSEGVPDYRCSADYFGMKDWFPIMCVQFENSAFLGYFRQVEPATRSESQYNDIADEYRPDYSFQEEHTGEKPPVEDGSDANDYIEGIAVKSAVQDDATLHRGANYRLTLPGRTGAGECVYSTPIRYLNDMQENCVWRMKSSLCSATSPLNALNYAKNSQGGSSLCRKGLLLLAQQSVAELAYVSVDYRCAGDNSTLLSPYLKSNATARDVYPEDVVQMFDYELPSRGEDCDFDLVTGAFICEELIVGEELPTAPVPPMCAWDDGNTDPPSPLIDNSGAVPVCQNAVVDVYYNFTWSGPEIVQLHATVVLGYIPMEEEDTTDGSSMDQQTTDNRTVLTQLLKVDFTHDIDYSIWESVESDINEDPNQDNVTLPWTRDQYQRSGKEGYLDGLPVISGIAVGTQSPDDSATTFDYVDTSLTSQLTLWSPGVDGLCENAGRTNINFSHNAIGSCLLRLGLDELVDCNYTRKLVLNRQDNLMLANYVSMIGDPNPRDLEDWIEIIRENVSNIFTDTPYQHANASEYVNDTIGICPNIPAGIHVDIMWAKAGKHNGTNLNDIVGAKIRYNLHTWSLYCTAKTGAACYGDTQWLDEIAGGRKFVQSFTLQSSVRFIEVPPKEPEAQTLYDANRETDYYYCRYDTCWEQAFYPWTEAYRGIDKDYVLGTSLAFSVYLVGYYLISRRWYEGSIQFLPGF